MLRTAAYRVALVLDWLKGGYILMYIAEVKSPTRPHTLREVLWKAGLLADPWR